MAGTRELKVEILGDATGAMRAMGHLDDGATRVGTGFKKMGLLVAAGIGAAIGGAVAFGKSALDAAGESMKVMAQTEAVIKSTGGTAGVTAEHIADLSHSLQGLSGVQDENIQTGANMLLTFTNIKNEAGKGKDIFDQATKTMLDMSVAMGSDAQTAAMQLGKALNDPINGMTALKRVGVTFTEEQKNQITVMQKMGDMAGAQAVILQELQREFGGSAEAAGAAMTPFERLKLKFGDFQEEVGTRLIPVLEKVADWLGQHVPKAIEFLRPAVETIGAVIKGIAEQVAAFWYTLRSGFTEDEGTGIERFALFLRNDLLPAVEHVVRVIREKWTQFSDWFKTIWPAIKEVVQRHIDIIRDLWDRFGGRIINIAQHMLEGVKGVFQGVFQAVQGVVELVTALLSGDWGKAWEAAKKIVDGLGEAIRAWAGAVLKIIGELVLAIGPAIGRVVESMSRAFFQKLNEFGYDLYLWFFRLPGKIVEWIGDVGRLLWDKGRQLAGGLVRGFWDRLTEWVSNPAVGAVLDTVAGPLRLGILAARGFMQQFDSGGVVGGPIGAPQLALVHGGETVLPTHKAGYRGGATVTNNYVTVNAPNYVGDAQQFADIVRRHIFDNGLTNGSAFAGRG